MQLCTIQGHADQTQTTSFMASYNACTLRCGAELNNVRLDMIHMTTWLATAFSWHVHSWARTITLKVVINAQDIQKVRIYQWKHLNRYFIALLGGSFTWRNTKQSRSGRVQHTSRTSLREEQSKPYDSLVSSISTVSLARMYTQIFKQHLQCLRCHPSWCNINKSVRVTPGSLSTLAVLIEVRCIVHKIKYVTLCLWTIHTNI